MLLLTLSYVFVALATVTSSVFGQNAAVEPFKTCKKAGYVALTFDDGPSPYTPILLKDLERENVTATFFVLGKQLENPDIKNYTKQAFDKGHQIASHTMAHHHLPELSDESLRKDVEKSEALIKGVIGSAPYYIRPPYGELSKNTSKVLNDMDYAIVNWDVDSNDWRYGDNSSLQHMAFDNVVKSIAGGTINSSFIVLQHDIHLFSVNMVPAIIKAIKAKGLKFTSVADCLGYPKPLYRNTAIESTINPNGEILKKDVNNSTTNDTIGISAANDTKAASNTGANTQTAAIQSCLLLTSLTLLARFIL
ncbi:hypothetical protein BDF19DRAFT_415586 [Syncephalis fuscata]|nr:hypothetical protein BDF19DRAFT_415586 [Syncephalis fuscata]